MVVPFGFSVGDFIAAIHLFKDVIDAFDDLKGASAEFQELSRELNSLQCGLMSIAKLRLDSSQQLEFDAVADAIDKCQKCVYEFLETISDFDRLGTNGNTKLSLATVKDGLRKIQWAVCKKDDLARFRTEVAWHADAIEMLLLTFQIKQTSEQGRKQETYFQQFSSQQATLAKISDRVQESNAMLHHLNGILQQPPITIGNRVQEDTTVRDQTHLLQSMSTEGLTDEQRLMFQRLQQQIELLHQQKDSLLRFVQNMESMLQTQKSIPPQVELQRPVTLLDACGRLAPFHLDFINSAEAFIAVLRVRFKHAGLEKIERGEFVIRETSRKRAIDLSKPWESALMPGQKIDMSMVFRKQNVPQSSCPGCQSVNGGFAEDEVECKACSMIYQRIIEQEVEPVEPESGHRHHQSGVNLDSPLSEELVQSMGTVDDIHQFRRVQIITKNLLPPPVLRAVGEHSTEFHQLEDPGANLSLWSDSSVQGFSDDAAQVLHLQGGGGSTHPQTPELNTFQRYSDIDDFNDEMQCIQGFYGVGDRGSTHPQTPELNTFQRYSDIDDFNDEMQCIQGFYGVGDRGRNSVISLGGGLMGRAKNMLGMAPEYSEMDLPLTEAGARESGTDARIGTLRRDKKFSAWKLRFGFGKGKVNSSALEP
ncbi:MAG: hypothetical protein M1840_006295 [Geoglossum simile]|nr:MAG: hypothetical protein M1840_006295 [Geoglossum simile]